MDTVRKWRMHWIGLQAVSLEDLSVSDRLADTPRPGRPSQITAEQTCQMIALACEQPAERPISHSQFDKRGEALREYFALTDWVVAKKLVGRELETNRLPSARNILESSMIAAMHRI